MKRSATAAEKAHMGRVQALGCVVCGFCYGWPDSPAQVHHVRERFGWGRSSHTASIPLCPEHHTGKAGVHSMGRDEFTTMHGISELDLLAVVNEQLGVTA